jgi:metallo-beta-lactamase family protein
VKFHRAGHILGSAFVECELPNGLRILHSGDLGRPDQPILRDPEPPPAADIVLVESTYGDRVHPSDGVERLAAAIRAGHARGGAILVPAFAVGRTQSLLWTLDELQRDGRIPRLSVFLDSPMAHRVGEATCRHGEDHDAEMRLATQEDRCPLCAGSYVRVSTPDESIALNSREGPFLVIAGSGMLSGGRILHHLAQRLGDERTTVLLTGFQAEGTRGRALVEGAPALRLFGKEVPVRARVEVIEGLSAHADREELLRWLALSPAPPRAVYAVHGEPGSAAALADTVRTRLGWPCVVPEQGMRVPLSLLAPTPRTSGPSG